MLKFYYQKLSLYSRPVWIALLEKQLLFESIELNLDGDQWQPEFLAINPFGRIPVSIDDDFAIYECLSILDYLELRYPTPALLPKESKILTLVHMSEMLALHELIPAMLALIRVTDSQHAMEQANRQITAMLSFLEQHLTGKTYIAGEQFSLAEIVAGSIIIWLPYLNIPLSNYPNVELWSNQLTQRPTWQITQPAPKVIQNWIKRIQKLPKVRARQWQQKSQKSKS